MKIIGSILFHLLPILWCASQGSGFIKNGKEFLRDYDKYQPPPPTNSSGSTAVKVTIRLFRLSLSLDYKSLTFSGDFNFVWSDKRLLSTMDIFYYSRDEIWSGVPSIAYMAGSKILELGSGTPGSNYFIRHGSTVFGGSTLSFQSLKACRSDLTNWPYDTKICNIYFISPAINSGRVGLVYDPANYIASKDGHTNKNLVRCHGWDIEKLFFNAEKNGSQIVLSIHLKRNDAKLTNYLFQQMVILLVSLSFFFLEPQSKERFILLLLVTISQIYCTMTLTLNTPRYYGYRPTLEYFIEMSTILILIQIFLVIICRSMFVTEYNPSFLSKMVSMVVMSRVLQTLFLLDVEPKAANELIEEQEEEGSFLIAKKNQTRKQWQLLSNLIHRATFYFTIVFSLYLICIVI